MSVAWARGRDSRREPAQLRVAGWAACAFAGRAAGAVGLAWPTRAVLGLLVLPWLIQCQASVGREARAAPPQAAHPDMAIEPTLVVLEPLGSPVVRVRVELAETPEARQRGLMFRRQLDPDAGMFFVFERAQPNSFWMRNTYLPLDMIFITADLRVLGVVENATPLTDSPRSVPGDSQYVLEVNAGFSRQHGIAPGTRVRLIKPASTKRGT